MSTKNFCFLSRLCRWRRVALVWALVISSFRAQAQRYVEIKAEIELISYFAKDQEGKPIEKRRTYPLKCIVGANEWRIDDEFALNGRQCSYFDGTTVYSSLQVIKDPALDTNFPGGKAPLSFFATAPFEESSNLLTIRIRPSPGGFPIGDLGVNIPWLAFCSGTYLKRDGRVIPLPTRPTSDEPENFGCRDDTRTFADDFGLPTSVRLFTSNARYQKALDDPRLDRGRRLELARTNPGLVTEDGKLRFNYQVDESTNFNGWNFPTKFTFIHNEPDRITGEWKPIAAGVGRMISVKEGTRPENVFSPDMNQTIVDYRFRHPTKLVDAIMYKATNGAAIPSTNDPVLQAKFAEKVKRARSVEDTSRP